MMDYEIVVRNEDAKKWQTDNTEKQGYSAVYRQGSMFMLLLRWQRKWEKAQKLLLFWLMEELDISQNIQMSITWFKLIKVSI